jgi:hypothetical protein
LHDILATHLLGKQMTFGVDIGIQKNLKQSRPIAKIEENKATVVSASVHPTSQGDDLTCIFSAEFTALN